MSSNHIFLMSISLTLMLIPGCSKQASYKPQNLTHLIDQSATASNSLSVQAKLLSKAETHTLFDGRAGRLLRALKPIFSTPSRSLSGWWIPKS
jgi:hypothetical protein